MLIQLILFYRTVYRSLAQNIARSARQEEAIMDEKAWYSQAFGYSSFRAFVNIRLAKRYKTDRKQICF